ncbi:MAG: ECF-type sigma factor, partial [Terriglobia bacterium]
MTSESPGEFTMLLAGLRQGRAEAMSRLVSLAYQELRRLAAHYMRQERPDHTLQATALVHEAYARLCGRETPEFKDRAHFFALAAQQMRRILVDHARDRQAAKRGGKQVRLSLDDVMGLGDSLNEDVIAVDLML